MENMLSTSQGYEKAFTRQAGDLVALQLPGHESVGYDDGASSKCASRDTRATDYSVLRAHGAGAVTCKIK